MIPLSLVEAALRGGSADVDLLVEAAWPYAYRIAYSVVRDRRFAEDAAQEACSILFQRMKALRSPKAFTVWFYRIVLREALRVERSRRKIRDHSDLPAEAPIIENSAGRLDLLCALDKLSHVDRAALLLHHVAGLSSREIGSILGVPDSSVRFFTLRARRRLQELLREDVIPDVGSQCANVR